MKNYIFICLISLFITCLSSMQVSSDEALNVASHWIDQVSNTNSVSEIQPITSPGHNDIVDWYAVSFANGGFILISAEDRVLPVLGYDMESHFRSSNLPENLNWFFNQYHEQIEIIRDLDASDIHPSWRAIRAGDYSQFMPQRAVSPLLQTNWNQDWPYNSMCPTASGGPGGHVYAGCGATTMGQIMKFWQYPPQGVGSHTYTHDTYGTLTANFGATTYNYASMPNSLNWTANTAISTLLYHCGVAIDMDYGIDGSGAQASDVKSAFTNYFAYENTARTVYQSGYTAAVWDNMMKTELDAGRPIFYFGTDSANGGHAFVCDGYQGTNYFHMNWGWSGDSNGYFYLTNLNPGYFHFNTQQGAVIGIKPAAPIAAPTNLTAIVDPGDNIYLEWQIPPSRGLLGYTVYRDGALLGTVSEPLNTYYFDINLTPGTYQYYVVANFSNGDSQPSNTAACTIYPQPIINYQDSFEAFADFNTTLSPWFSYDLDQAQTYGLPNTDYPSKGQPESFVIFNPAATTPPTTAFSAQAGQKLLICFGSLNSGNNDWIVSPKWNTGNIGRLRFWAKSAFPDTYLEQIKVGVNPTSPEPSGMTIISGATPITVPGEWTEYNFTLSDYLYANVFVGIQCVSYNGKALLLDRIQLWSSYVNNDDNTVSEVTDTNLNVYPNPFSTGTSIHWQQKSEAKVSIKIYDTKGRIIRTLKTDFAKSGDNNLVWNGMDDNGNKVANGIYFCKLQSPSSHQTQKIIKMN